MKRFWSEWGDLIQGLTLILIVSIFITFALIGTIAFVVTGVDSFWNYNICQELKELDQDHSYEWRLFGGCMVQTPAGYWIGIGNAGQVDIPQLERSE